MATRSPYDRLLGNAPAPETQGETTLFSSPIDPATANLFPTSTGSTSSVDLNNPASAGRFVTINEFFGADQYKNALLPEKMELEDAYRKQFLTEDAMTGAGANAKQRSAAVADFNKRRARVAPDGVLDNDLLDSAAYGLANAVGGVARIFGADSLADRAKADADRIERENFSNATRFKRDEATLRQRRLAEQYGGEDNIPWWQEVKNGLSNFAAQPINKTIEALGSSAPTLVASLGLAATAAPAAVGVPVMALMGALMASGDSAEGAYQKIVGMTEKELSGSPEYTDLRRSGMGHEAARKQVADNAVREAAMLAAPIGAVTGGMGARVGAEAMIMRGAAARGVLRNTAAEAAQEAAEEGGTQATSNIAVRRADPSQPIMTGVAGAATEGALASGGITATGAAVRAMGNRSPESPAAADPTQSVEDPAPTPEQLAEDLADEGLAPGVVPPPAGVGPADQADTARALLEGGTLPARITADPGVQAMQALIAEQDIESTDPMEIVRARNELIGRVAYVQAADAVTVAGGNPAIDLADMSPKQIRDRYLQGFNSQIWTEPIRNALMAQARQARQQYVDSQPAMEDIPEFTQSSPPAAAPAPAPVAAPAQTPAPAAAAPFTTSALSDLKLSGKPEPVAFGVAQRLDEIEYGGARDESAAAAAALKELVLAVQGAGDDIRQVLPGKTAAELAQAYGITQTLPAPVAARANDMLAQIAQQVPGAKPAARVAPAAAQPSPPAAPALNIPAPRNDVAPAVMPDDTRSPLPAALTKQWKVPARSSRATKNFDERSLTDPITNEERAAVTASQPVNALLSIADRYKGTTTGEFARDLVRTVAADVKTKAGRERLKTVAARWSPAGGPRGTVSIPGAPVTVHALLHEFAHALTVASIRSPTTERQKTAVKELTSVMKWVGQNLPPNSNVRNGITVQGVFTDVAEFAAEVYANPMLQNYLKTIPSTNTLPEKRQTTKSLWDIFLDNVAKLLKIRRTALYDTLYTLREIDDGTLSNQARVRKAAANPAAAGQSTGQSAGPPVDAEVRPEDVDGGQDHSVIPDVGAGPGFSAGALGPAIGDTAVAAAVSGTTGANVVVADIAGKVLDTVPEPTQAEIIAAAARLGISPERMAAAAARKGRPPRLKRELPKLDAALEETTKRMDQLAQMPLRRRVQTALDHVTQGTSTIRTYDDMMRALATGEMPTISRFDKLWGDVRERFIDSGTPFLRMIGWDQNLNLWKAYKRAGAKLQEENKVLNNQLRDINLAVNQFAKKLGLPVSEAFAYADRYATARYVAKGANEELAIRNAEALQEAQTAIASARGRLQMLITTAPTSTQIAGIKSKVDNLRKRIAELQRWQADYSQMNDLVRGRDPDANGVMSVVHPDHRFIAGMTRQEGKEAVAAVVQRFGPAMAEVDAIANRIVGLHRFWANRSLQGKIYFPSEAAQWSQNRFKGSSGDFYVPVAGNDNLRDQESLYAVGGMAFKDYAEEGRATIGDGAYMSIVHYAASMAQRVAHQEFSAELYANAAAGNHGMMALAYSDNAPGNKRTFLYKEQMPSGRVVVHKVALNDDTAADAIVGANRHQVESAVMRGLGALTSNLGFMVTQATMMFGPINMFRDFGEKAYTMVAKHTDVPKAAFLTRAVAEFTNMMGNFGAAWRYAGGDMDGQSQADKDLRELAHMGGLNTRTGSVNREADKIVSAIRAQAPGFRQIGDLKEWIGKYNEAFEIHASLAIYRALKATTKASIPDNAYRLLDSMNFSQSGSVSPALRVLYLFFNPTVQGARNTYESLIRGIASKGPAGNRKRAVALATLAGAFMLYGLSRAIGGDDDDFGNRTDSLASNTVSRNIPLWIGGDRYVRIPVPFGAPAVLWNLAVGASRFSTGKMDAEEALLHMMQSTAEHTVPFPISQVDVAKDPTFWAMKTLIPQIVSPLVNIGADKNDFGDKLTAQFVDRDAPAYTQGRRNTPQQWKDIAAFMAKNGLGDYHPEAVRELTRVGLIGPLEHIGAFALGVEQKDNDLHYFGKALGMNRVYTKDPRGLIRSFYEAEANDTKLVQQVYYSAGSPPKDLRGDARLSALQDWIGSSALSPQDQQRAFLTFQFDKRMRDARSGKSSETEQDVMRAYLQERRAIAGN